nr:hypothetical protein [uncultured bacterium]
MAGGAPTNIWRFTPLAAAGGVALGIAAWTLPLPGVSVSPEVAPEAGVTPPGARPSTLDKYLTPIAHHDWTELVPALSEVRPPAPVAVVDDPGNEQPPPPPVDNPLSGWRFAGLVEEPDGLVAIVSVVKELNQSEQRYLRVGEVVTLPGGGRQAEIVGIETDHVVVRVDGVEYRVMSTGATAPAMTAPRNGDAGRLMPPTTTRGRSRTPGRS